MTSRAAKTPMPAPLMGDRVGTAIGWFLLGTAIGALVYAWLAGQVCG